jgi:hypothetical protein
MQTTNLASDTAISIWYIDGYLPDDPEESVFCQHAMSLAEAEAKLAALRADPEMHPDMVYRIEQD